MQKTSGFERALEWVSLFLLIIALTQIPKIVDFLSSIQTNEQSIFIKDKNIEKPKSWLKNLCVEKKQCKEFISVRKQCATAGDIEKCVKIKMNNEVPALCSDNGHIVIPQSIFTKRVDLDDSKITPQYLQCLLLELSSED
jgi:hypothetical protein